MLELIEMLKKNEDCTYIGLSTETDNHTALQFYESLGFINTGEMLDEHEVILELRVK
jgi:diamine N-acetyltransferase